MEGSLNYRKTTGFLSLLMTVLFSGIIIGRAQESPLDVNGIVGGSVLLPLIIPQGRSILEVRWKLINKVRLGDSKGKKFEAFHLASPTITQRLEMENAATLRITTVTKNDSGIYRAEVQYENGINEEKEFRLNVYDPVPVPYIEKESLSNTSEGCNVTLVCRMSTENDLNFLWIKRETKDSTQFQNISAGQKLHLSLSGNLMDSEYFCLVSNPADQKNTSTFNVCPRDSPLEMRMFGYFIIPVALIVLSILGVFIFLKMKKKKKKKKKKRDEASTHFELLTTSVGEIQYTEINVTPPDVIEQVKGGQEQMSKYLQPGPISTVYAEVCIQ
ncbi:CD48 antigen-like [Pleurodeles waltl]|uniref:CD48 antigen-like n=1 Tax=Pleurodeles waltl TaxID=8319 RepID=UPI0037095230